MHTEPKPMPDTGIPSESAHGPNVAYVAKSGNAGQPTSNKAPRHRWPVILAIGAITLLALLVRLLHVHTAIVDHPLRGDAVQYFAYALNLVDHHVFSMAAPDGVATPDSFRDPGYPTFLALLIMCFGREQSFYLATLDIQCALSAATVGIYMILARRWLGTASAVIVGLGLTFWPHLITLSGYLLSETLVGFLVASGLLVTQCALDRRSLPLTVMAGIVFACAGLTNAVFLPIVPCFAVIAAWKSRERRSAWLVLLIAAALPGAIWMARGATLPTELTASGRVAMNFAQGSWPEYHTAWYHAIADDDAKAKAVISAIDQDVQRMSTSPAKGLASIAHRMSEQPGRYIAWYLSKPIELWGWNIGVGEGDIYVFPTFNSPLSTPGPLKLITDVLFLINPLITLLAVIGLVYIFVRARHTEPVLLLCAAITVFITAVFALLQSDARYASPYRGAEWLLVVRGFIAVGELLKKLRTRNAIHP